MKEKVEAKGCTSFSIHNLYLLLARKYFKKKKKKKKKKEKVGALTVKNLF